MVLLGPFLNIFLCNFPLCVFLLVLNPVRPVGISCPSPELLMTQWLPGQSICSFFSVGKGWKLLVSAITGPVIIEGLKYPTDNIKYFNRLSQKAVLMQKIESPYKNEMSSLLSFLFSLLA